MARRPTPAKITDAPCPGCPFRKASTPGRLGRFDALTLHHLTMHAETPLGCNREAPPDACPLTGRAARSDGRGARTFGDLCIGQAMFMANSHKDPAPGLLHDAVEALPRTPYNEEALEGGEVVGGEEVLRDWTWWEHHAPDSPPAKACRKAARKTPATSAMLEEVQRRAGRIP